MKTKISILIAFLMMFNFIASSQGEHKRPNMAELREGKWKYMVETAKLSDDDAAKIKPLFNEFEDKVWKFVEKNREAFRGNRKKDKTPEDYKIMNENLVNFDIQKAQYQKEYYQSLKKEVSPEVIHRLLKAERNFIRDLMRKQSPSSPSK